MATQFYSLLNQIPDADKLNTEKHIFSDIAIFRPREYLAGNSLIFSDFNVTIPSVPAPPAYFNNKYTTMEHGNIVVFNPNDTMRCLESHTNRPFLSIFIKPRLISAIAKEMDFEGDIRFQDFKYPNSIGLMQAVTSLEYELNRPDCLNMLLDSLGVQIAATMLRDFKSNIKKYPVNMLPCDAYVQLAMEYMQTFFSTNITIDDICNEIGVSPFHFIRYFKKKTGLSPHQYLINVRLKKAEELLRGNRFSVAEVAKLCGFVSVPHFSSSFKAMTGRSPSDFKRKPF